MLFGVPELAGSSERTCSEEEGVGGGGVAEEIAAGGGVGGGGVVEEIAAGGVAKEGIAAGDVAGDVFRSSRVP